MVQILNSTQDVWINNINHLFKKEYLHLFFPSQDLNTKENINSIMRFSIYSSLLLTLVYKNLYYLMIIIIATITTYIYYNMNKGNITEHLKTDMLHNKLFVKEIKSRPDNPVMNKLIGESNNEYKDSYLISSDREITDNVMFEYNKLYNSAIAAQRDSNLSYTEDDDEADKDKDKDKDKDSKKSDDTENKGNGAEVHKDIPVFDILNEKEAILNFCPLADKTGIPNFAKFAKNIYGTRLEERGELIKRGYLSKSDSRLYRDSVDIIDFDPLNIEEM